MQRSSSHMLWSDLTPDRGRIDFELAKLESAIALGDLLRAALKDEQVRDRARFLWGRSKESPDGLSRFLLWWYGDERHPLPDGRVLPPLEETDGVTKAPDGNGSGRRARSRGGARSTSRPFS